jgi:hypothetical protein
MTLRLLAAVLPHGNKSRGESSRHLIRGCPYTATGRMPYMETGTFCLRESPEHAKRDVYESARRFRMFPKVSAIGTVACVNRTLRFLTFAKVSAIDVGARVVHSRSGINSRDFCKESQNKFSSSANHNSLSLSISLAHCLFMYLDYISLIHDLVTTTFGGLNETTEK